MYYRDDIRKARAEIFALMENPFWTEVTTRDIRTVVVILSSSRSGSTLLTELLKQTPQLLSLQGEHVPFYKLSGYSFPANGLDSDRAVHLNPSDFSELSRDVLSEIGVGVERGTFPHFVHILVLRLMLQWPHLGLSAQAWLSYIHRAHHYLLQREARMDVPALVFTLCKILCADGYVVNPSYYDFPKEGLHTDSPSFAPAQGPPHPDCCLEEPPFIVVQPRRAPTADEIRAKPLLLKASVDAYRVPLLQQLFPRAQLKVLHLTRNPAACINGLYDGWLDRGFFSHCVKPHAVLSIAGYSDRSTWGSWWWNYDLPPQWKTVINDPLEYVCAFQWYQAHTSILESIRYQDDIQVMRVKFEDLLCSPRQRWQTMQQITTFVGIAFDHFLQTIIANMPIVMATVTPRNRRWQARQAQLRPVVTQSHVVALSHELGYSIEQDWI